MQQRQKGTLSSDAIKNQAQEGGMAKTVKSANNEEASQTVLDLMIEVTKNQGSKFCHRSDIWTICQNKMSHQDFTAAINSLLEDGAIYTAIDDNQFGITD